MSKNFGSLNAKITANTDDFKANLSKASKEAEGFKDKVSKSLESVTGAANELSPAVGNVLSNITELTSASGGPLTLALAAAAGGLLAMTSRSIESAQAFEDFRDSTQLSVEELAKFEYIALKNGTSLEDFSASIVKMQKTLREARDGNAETAVTFARLGININEALQDKDGGVKRVATAINDMASATERAEVVTTLFGKSGAKMTANLLDIAEGAGEATNRTEEAQAEFDKFYKTLNEVKISAGNAGDAISVRLVSGVNSLIAKLREAAADAQPLWSAIVNAPIGKTTVAKTTGNIVDNMFGGAPKVNDPRLSTGLIGDKNYQDKVKANDEAAAKDELIKNRAIARNARYKAGLAELEKQLNSGALSQAQYNQKVKDYKDNFDKVEVKGTESKSSNKDSKKEPKIEKDPIDQAYLKTLDDIAKKTQEIDLASQDLSNTEKDLAKLRASPEFALMSEKQQEEIDLSYSQLILNEKLADAQKRINDLLKETSNEKLKEQKLVTDEINSAYRQGNITLKERNELLSQVDPYQQNAKNLYKNTKSGQKEENSKQKQGVIDAYNNEVFGDVGSVEALQKYKETLKQVDDEAKKLNGTFIDISSAVDNAAADMAQAFLDFTTGAQTSFSKMAQSILADLAKMIIRQQIFIALKMGFSAIGASFGSATGPIGAGVSTGSMPIESANGNVFSAGYGGPNLVPFANGGIFDKPIMFPMSGGRTGLAGEAGFEAIMPLTRINGKLGVHAVGGGNNQVINQVNVTVQGGSNPDETGAKVSEAVIRALAKQEIANAKRFGGILSK